MAAIKLDIIQDEIVLAGADTKALSIEEVFDFLYNDRRVDGEKPEYSQAFGELKFRKRPVKINYTLKSGAIKPTVLGKSLSDNNVQSLIKRVVSQSLI